MWGAVLRAHGERARRVGEESEPWTHLASKLCPSIPRSRFRAFDILSSTVRPPGETAAQRAYAYVKQRLLDGRFPGGMLLSENALAQELEISRTPIRQAFGQLEAEGLVELYPRRGALVVPISASEADDVREARELIEPFCARRAAEAAAPRWRPSSRPRSPSRSAR